MDAMDQLSYPNISSAQPKSTLKALWNKHRSFFFSGTYPKNRKAYPCRMTGLKV